jgi:hypothetical protein
MAFEQHNEGVGITLKIKGLHGGEGDTLGLEGLSIPKLEVSNDSQELPCSDSGTDLMYEGHVSSSESITQTDSETESISGDSHVSVEAKQRENESSHNNGLEDFQPVSGSNDVQKKGKRFLRIKMGNENTFNEHLTTPWKEDNESESDESFDHGFMGYDSSNASESVDLSELNSIRNDIISSDGTDAEETDDKKYEENSSDSEDDQEKWDRISRTVERMKLLMLKYPQFTTRVGNNHIITALHSMMDTLAERKSPTSADIKMVEAQMENFKSVLITGIEEDLVRWKSKRKGYRFYVIRCLTILAIMAAIVSVSFKYATD